jgi:hypothetical protein
VLFKVNQKIEAARLYIIQLAQGEIGAERALRTSAPGSFPNPFTNAASVQRYFPWILVWQEVQQADDLNEVGFSAAVGADENVQVAQFDWLRPGAEGEKIDRVD